MTGWTLFFTIIAALAAPIGLATLLLMRASERRALEARDAVWSRELTNAGWSFQHSGSLPLSDVKIVFTIDGITEISRFDTVRPHTPVLAVNSEHERTITLMDERHAEHAREVEAAENPPSMTLPHPTIEGLRIPIPGVPTHFSTRPALPVFPIKADMNAIITWRYPSGAPDTQEIAWTETY